MAVVDSIWIIYSTWVSVSIARPVHKISYVGRSHMARPIALSLRHNHMGDQVSSTAVMSCVSQQLM